ncbi:MAG: SDR family NAD(P)-dependent oxidoreductase [Saprospiraceae bacterium]
MGLKTVLITGGSSGIGYGLSKKFAADGYRLLWVSKETEELAKAKTEILKNFPAIEVHTLTKNLSIEESCSEVYDWAKNIGRIDVVVNNAGFGTYGYLNDINIQQELAMINLNIRALYLLTRFFLKDMVERNGGNIINISSNSSFETVPRLLTYSSTKAFVKHFSRGLNEELKMQNSKVKVLTICPAAIKDTNFKNAGDMANVTTFNKGMVTTTTKEVVSDIWKAFQKGKSFQITGWKMRMLHKSYGFVPFWLTMLLTKGETEDVK